MPLPDTRRPALPPDPASPIAPSRGLAIGCIVSVGLWILIVVVLAVL